MKKTIRILAVIIAMTCIFSGTAFAQEKEVAVEKSSSIARADVIKYVYKVENGKLYRIINNKTKYTTLRDCELCVYSNNMIIIFNKYVHYFLRFEFKVM